MRHRLLFVLLVILSFVALAKNPKEPEDSAIFLKNGMRWQKSSSKLHHSYGTVAGTLLLFHASGQFEEVTSLFHRDADGTVSIDMKSGYTIREGNWKTTNHNSLTIKARLIYTSTPRVGSTGGVGADEEKTCKFDGSERLMAASRVVCGPSKFDRTSTLQNTGELNKTIQFQETASARRP